jgi:hypothetical protein
MQKFRSRNLGFLVAMAAILSGAPAMAGTPPTTRAFSSPLVIPGSAFVNDGIDPDGATLGNGAVVGTGIKVNMVAPVYLPDGATVGAFRAYLYDNDDVCDTNGEDIDLFLVRTSLVTGTVDTVAIAASDGASGLTQFVPTHTLYTSKATINNSSYQYWIQMRICSASHRMNAVVVYY